MAIPHLTDEEVRTLTVEQKDRWWLTNVWRGDMPQLTIRAALTGFVLGGLLSATNLYVGAKTGWGLGVGLTSVILAFAMFKILSRLGAQDMTILENNCMQSIATAAGYMTGPLIAGMAAYMWVENALIPWWQMLLFNVVLSILGVLVAFPMKKKFINDEQQPFPEGRACGVVLDTLYTSAAAVGMFKAKALMIAAGLAGFITFLAGEAYLKALHALYLMVRTGESWSSVLAAQKEKLDATWHLPHRLDGWYYGLVEKGVMPMPKVLGLEVQKIGVYPALDLALFGAGGLMGIRAASSMLIGMLINFLIVVPIAVSEGWIRTPPNGNWTRVWVLNNWALWWGITIMVVASMVSLFAKPKVFTEAFRMVFNRRGAAPAAEGDTAATMRRIELPLWISFIGVPIVGALGVWMANVWFGVPILAGTIAIPLIIVLTLIAASSTGMTGITPTGALSKIPQFLFGAQYPKHPPTNLMTAVMCSEVALNASNLLMDIKPGYMLGAKPRQQAIGHCIGIVAGALASTPLFYILFLSSYSDAGAAEAAAQAAATGQPNTYIQGVMAPEGGQFGFPAAFQWKGVSDLVTSIFGGTSADSLLTTSVIWSIIIAGVAGLAMEILRVVTRSKFPISPLAIGLGVVVPPESTIAMFAGALFFWFMHRFYAEYKESRGNLLWVQTQEPICAGIIAGAALVGIGDVLVKVFALG